MIFFSFFSNFSFLEISNLMAGSCFKKLLRLVVCKTSFYLFIYKERFAKTGGIISIYYTQILKKFVLFSTYEGCESEPFWRVQDKMKTRLGTAQP